jgi:hypothetical protein
MNLPTWGKPVHPNLIAVPCANKDDMRKLAQEMRAVCLQDVDQIEGYEGSPTEGEAKIRAAQMQDDLISSGQLRFINYTPDYRLTNVCFTLMERSDGLKQWNLSMSHGSPSGPQRVADDLATMIAEAFLDEGYEEVETKAYWKTIRHFVKDMP